MMNVIARFAGAGLLAVVTAVQAAGMAPDELVKSTVNDVLAVIQQTKDPRALVELAEKKVVVHFDFKRMTQLAMGRSWSQASPAQQEALEREFRTLLVRTYTTALSQSSGQARVEIKPSPPASGQETVVRTLVSEPGRTPFSIDYRMRNGTDGWKVYDVVVENLSLVTNYRASFQSEISRSGIDGLIKVIESKNAKQG